MCCKNIFYAAVSRCFNSGNENCVNWRFICRKEVGKNKCIIETSSDFQLNIPSLNLSPPECLTITANCTLFLKSFGKLRPTLNFKHFQHLSIGF